MKTALEVAQDLTGRPAVAEPTELPYEHAYKIALETGKSVEQVQNEHRRLQTPITPLAKALATLATAEANRDKAAVQVEEGLALQSQFEALVARRDAIRATLARGTELLAQSLASIEDLKLQWLNWHVIEEQSPGRTQAVYLTVESLVMQERLVSLFPAWQEHQSGQLHQVAEQLARFEREYGFKAR
jgi:hypothetical protein